MPTITNAICATFKDEVMGGTHDLDASGDTLKIALIKNLESLAVDSFGVETTNYSDLTGNANEATGSGYTAGGATLAGQVVANDGSTAYLDFTDASWTIDGIVTAGGALIYNSSQGNKAIAVIDFGSAKTANNQTFVIEFPEASASTAIIRSN